MNLLYLLPFAMTRVLKARDLIKFIQTIQDPYCLSPICLILLPALETIIGKTCLRTVLSESDTLLNLYWLIISQFQLFGHSHINFPIIYLLPKYFCFIVQFVALEFIVDYSSKEIVHSFIFCDSSSFFASSTFVF